MADMKQLLLRLGERLVGEHGFQPAHSGKIKIKSTEPLVTFLVWLDKTPEAREELEKLGHGFLRTLPFGDCCGKTSDRGQERSEHA